MPVSSKTVIRRNERKRLILEIIRNTPEASRTAIQKLSGLSMDSTLHLVEELLKSGLIYSVGKSNTQKPGRKATILQINSEGCYFLGIRFNASSITGVVINFAREEILSREWDCREKTSSQEMIAFLAECIGELLVEIGEKRAKVRGIGIGAPGIIDLKKGSIIRYVHIPDWKNVELKKTFESQFNIPVWVEHGVKCATRAFLTLPEHSDCKDMLFMQMDRGINMCIVANGQIYNGSSYLSGETGHVHVDNNGILCDCGRFGCLETIASDNAILRAAQNLLNEGHCDILKSMIDTGLPLWVSTICDAEMAGDSDCGKLMESVGYGAGKVMAMSLGILNPRHFVLTGWAASSPAFRDSVMRCLREECLDETVQACRVFFGLRDKLADARGAAELPFSKLFDKRVHEYC